MKKTETRTDNARSEAAPATPSLFSLLRPYAGIIALLVLLTVLSNGLNLLVPQLIKHAIDTYTLGSFALLRLIEEFAAVAVFIFAFTYGQNVVQVYASERVARDPEALRRLEAIVHPLVAAERTGFLAGAAAMGAEVVVLDIPLLFEAGREGEVDAVVVVSAPAEVQRARVLARPGMTEDRLKAILDRQLPDEEKRARADFVVESGRDASALLVK